MELSGMKSYVCLYSGQFTREDSVPGWAWKYLNVTELGDGDKETYPLLHYFYQLVFKMLEAFLISVFFMHQSN